MANKVKNAAAQTAQKLAVIDNKLDAFLDITSGKNKLKTILEWSSINGFDIDFIGLYDVDFIALYIAAQKLNDPETNKKLAEINQSIEKTAGSLIGYITSEYFIDRLTSMSYTELCAALNEEFDNVPRIFNDVDSETLDHIFSLKSVLRKDTEAKVNIIKKIRFVGACIHPDPDWKFMTNK